MQAICSPETLVEFHWITWRCILEYRTLLINICLPTSPFWKTYNQTYDIILLSVVFVPILNFCYEAYEITLLSKCLWVPVSVRICLSVKSKSHYDHNESAGPVLVSGAHLGPATNFSISVRCSFRQLLFELSSIECIDFYAVHAVSKESRRLLIPRICILLSVSLTLWKTLLKRHG
jgi:hypothetical protein